MSRSTLAGMLIGLGAGAFAVGRLGISWKVVIMAQISLMLAYAIDEGVRRYDLHV